MMPSIVEVYHITSEKRFLPVERYTSMFKQKDTVKAMRNALQEMRQSIYLPGTVFSDYLKYK